MPGIHEEDSLDSIRATREALEDASRVHDNARRTMFDFVVQAIGAGKPIDPLIDACGFKEDFDDHDSPQGFMSIFGAVKPSRRERFIQWLCNELTEIIREAP